MPIRGAKDLQRILTDVSGLFGNGIIGAVYSNNGHPKDPSKWGNRICILETTKCRIEAHQFLRNISGQPPHISVSVYREKFPLLESDLERNVMVRRLGEEKIEVINGSPYLTFRTPPTEPELRHALFTFYNIMDDFYKARNIYSQILRS